MVSIQRKALSQSSFFEDWRISLEQCWDSVTFWYGSGSVDPCLWLSDPVPVPFFSGFKVPKKYFHIFSYNLPAGTFSSVLILNFLLKFCSNFILQALFQSTQHLFEKGKEPDSDLYLWWIDPDRGGPKTWGSRSLTLLWSIGGTLTCISVIRYYLGFGSSLNPWNLLKLIFSLESCKNENFGVPYRQCRRCGHSCEGGIQPRGHRRQYTAQVC